MATDKKKELLQYSKSKLVKQCRAKGLSTNGSKSELIDRLFKCNKNKSTKKASRKRIKMNWKHKSDYLIQGYIRKTTSNNEYTMSLIILMIQFLGVGLRFDICSKKQIIFANGTEIKREVINAPTRTTHRSNGIVIRYRKSDKRKPLPIVITSSIGWNNGINEWRIKAIKAGYYDVFGIVPNESRDAIKTLSDLSKTPNTYYYTNGCAIESGKNSVKKYKMRQNIPRFFDKAVISIVLNCEQWSIKFLLNNTLMKKELKITPDITYHPVVVSAYNYTNYKISSTI
eukprot:21567_1